MREISSVSERGNYNYIENNRESAPDYKAGDILKASLLSRSNGKAHLIAENGLEFSVDSKKVKGEAGDVLKFKVKKWGSKGIELKQLENDFDTNIENMTRRLSAKNLASLMKSHNMLSDGKPLNGKDSYTEEQIKTAQKVAKIKAELARCGSNGDVNIIAELIQSGLSLSKIGTGVLNSVATEAEYRTANIMSASELTAALKRSGASGERNKMIIQALYAQGLQSDEQSITALNRFLDKLQSLPIPDENSIIRILKDNRDITYENIYSAIHAGKRGADDEMLSDTEVKDLSAEISKTLNREAISENDRHLAESLVKSGVPLNKDNIDKAKFLARLEEMLNENGSLEQILGKAAKNIKDRKSLQGIELFSRVEVAGKPIDKPAALEQIKSIIRSLPHYRNADIAKAARGSRLVSLQDIDEAYNERINENMPDSVGNDTENDNALGYTDTDGQYKETRQTTVSNNLMPNVVTARRQIEEIRLKLTVQAANALVGKNLPISVMPLKDVVDALRSAEGDMHSKNLRIMGGAQADTHSNIEKMNGLFDKLNDIKPATYNMFADIAQQRVPFTVNGAHESVMAAKKAVGSYDNHATLPSARFGDSFNKVKDQFDKLLRNIDIEASKENIRAAEILSRNNMEIDSTNIAEIRAVDSKLTAVLNRLHPSIAAKMITDGLDPTEMHVDEVLEYIDQFNKQYGEDLSQKIAECLLDMDSAEYRENRDAVIAVYRLLNLIQKDGGAAIGINKKAGRDATLGNLLDSAKYYSRTKGTRTASDYRIDDDFGALESLNIPESNIRMKLEEARLRAIKDRSEAQLGKEGIQEYKDYEDKFLELNLGKTLKNLDLIDKLTDEGMDSGAAKQIASNISVIENTLKELASYATHKAFNYAGKSLNEPSLMNVRPQEILELLKEYHQNNDSIGIDNETALAEQIGKLAGIPDNIIRDAAAIGMPLIIGNLNALKSIRENPDFLRQSLNAAALADGADGQEIYDEDIPIPDADLKELKEGSSPDQIMRNIEDSLDGRPLVREIKLIQTAIKVQNFINRSDNKKPVSIPVRLKDGVAMLNMYVVNQKAADEKSNVFMTVKTNSGANINARFTLNGDEPVSVNVDGVDIDDTGLWRSLPENMSEAGLYDIVSGILKYIDMRM